MPGNEVKINGSKELSWYVGDSKMEELIKFLNEVGTKENSASLPKFNDGIEAPPPNK